jgi:hypothetical protein
MSESSFQSDAVITRPYFADGQRHHLAHGSMRWVEAQKYAQTTDRLLVASDQTTFASNVLKQVRKTPETPELDRSHEAPACSDVRSSTAGDDYRFVERVEAFE